MKVYLASSFEEASRLRAWRDEHFAPRKLTSTSSWLEVAVGACACDCYRMLSNQLVEHAINCASLRPMPPMGESDAHRRDMARLDVANLIAADALVLFNDLHLHGRGRGGRHVELGIALGWNAVADPLKLIVVVGVRENVFHYHDQVRWVPDGDAALAVLDEHHKSLNCCKEQG